MSSTPGQPSSPETSAVPGRARPQPRTVPATGSGAVDQAQALWCTLSALGVREAVIAPGSRSAPFVHALAALGAELGIRAHVRIDERAAAFTALGISRADPAHPGVVVTTSGTAAAHLHAAVLEAHHARVPLVVITADRPAELRDTGANQTTHQAGLYGRAVRFAADLPAPSAARASASELRTAVSTTARALAVATGEHPGPVHLNIALRDPLAPRPGHLTPEGPLVLPAPTLRVPRGAPTPVEVQLGPRTVVVAGDGAGPAAAELARAEQLPLLAEPSSGARSGPSLVRAHLALLAEVMADPGHRLRPRTAVVMGRPTLSRTVVRDLLGADDVEVIVVDPTDAWADAARSARLVVPAIAPAGGADPRERAQHLADWQRAGALQVLAEPPWQARAALAVWDAQQDQDVLVLGSSSLVRDLDHRAGPARGAVVANRGLAGIDGMISTATGLALARRARPGRVRALLGDLTAVHDLTGLVIGPLEPIPDLDVVVVDDGGGRIFSGLEHSTAGAEVLRRFFTTPHGVDLAAAGRALGLDARTLVPEELPGALAERPGGRRLLVVREPGAPS